MKDKKEYLFWSKGLSIGILGSIFGSILVSSGFNIYALFDFSKIINLFVFGLSLLMSLIALILLFNKYKKQENIIKFELDKIKWQNELYEELENGRIKSALKILEKSPNLKFNFSKALYFILKKNEDPNFLLEEYKKIKEIYELENETYTKGNNQDNIFLGSSDDDNPSGELRNIFILRYFLTGEYKEPFTQQHFTDVARSCPGSMNPFWYLKDNFSENIIDYLLYFIFYNETQTPFAGSYRHIGDNKESYEEFNQYISQMIELIDLLNTNDYIPKSVKEVICNFKNNILNQKKDLKSLAINN